MATSESVQKIIDAAKEVTDLPIDQLIRNQDQWGPINFDAARDDLQLIYSLCTHFQDLPIEQIPNGAQTQIFNALNQVVASIRTIRAFNIQSQNPTGQRDALVNQVKQQGEALLNATQSWIGFLAYQKGDVQKNITSLRNAVKEADQIVGAAKLDAQEKKAEVDSIITAAREASASAGVGVFTSDFDGERNRLETQARTWLKATGAMASLTITAAFASFFFPISKESTNAQIVQFMTSKVIILLVFFTATIWCGRIYKALRHQAATNAHRANALKTFQAFVKAAADDQTRDAVLVETTRSIFAIAQTGFIEGGDTSADGGMKIFEIIKGAMGKG